MAFINTNIFEEAKRIANNPPPDKFKFHAVVMTAKKLEDKTFEKLMDDLSVNPSATIEKSAWEEIQRTRPLIIYMLALGRVLKEYGTDFSKGYNRITSRKERIKREIDAMRKELMEGWAPLKEDPDLSLTKTISVDPEDFKLLLQSMHISLIPHDYTHIFAKPSGIVHCTTGQAIISKGLFDHMQMKMGLGLN